MFDQVDSSYLHIYLNCDIIVLAVKNIIKKTFSYNWILVKMTDTFYQELLRFYPSFKKYLYNCNLLSRLCHNRQAVYGIDL